MAYVLVLTDFFFYFFDTALQLMTVVNVIMAHISAWAVIFLFFAAEQFLSKYRHKLVVRDAKDEIAGKAAEKEAKGVEA